MSRDTGGHAFPSFVPEGHYNGSVDEAGITVRDYFASAAMARMMTTYRPTNITMGENVINGLRIDAALAYAAADAMIAERSKP